MPDIPDLAPWRSLLAKALHNNRSLVYSRYLQLATITADRQPSNRTVVFRGFLNPGNRLQIITDIRSEKVPQIAANPHAEACWYFPKTRVQFRLAGTIAIVTATTDDATLQAARRAAWEKLSDNARSGFAWPQPGADRADPSAFEVEPPTPTDPLADFALLLLEPDRVDRLQLRGNPQQRQIFTRSATGWEQREVNP
jgi:PPOX class probable FMN-dependent enzyme